MKKSISTWIGCILGLSLCASVYADMISASFGTTAVTKGEVYDDSSWTQLSYGVWAAGQTTVTNSNIGGTTLDAVVVSDARGQLGAVWENFANKIFMGGTSNATVTLSLSEIPYEQYMVVVYLGGDASNNGYISDGTATYYYHLDDSVASTGVQTLSTDTVDNSPGWNTSASYVVFGSGSSPLTADSLTLTMAHPAGANSSAKVGIGGFQIIAVPEPATMGLFGFASLACLFFRKLYR